MPAVSEGTMDGATENSGSGGQWGRNGGCDGDEDGRWREGKALSRDDVTDGDGDALHDEPGRKGEWMTDSVRMVEMSKRGEKEWTKVQGERLRARARRVQWAGTEGKRDLSIRGSLRGEADEIAVRRISSESPLLSSEREGISPTHPRIHLPQRIPPIPPTAPLLYHHRTRQKKRFRKAPRRASYKRAATPSGCPIKLPKRPVGSRSTAHRKRLVKVETIPKKEIDSLRLSAKKIDRRRPQRLRPPLTQPPRRLEETQREAKPPRPTLPP
ncbi:hypothetical protein B0H17DRAFT_1187077 [Mycena rosella]|uniref:Uncharacterized protein n=1 Tax=Mycena rosella TaxID=1033263 RepID=A0AAD7CA16_MYCRO|nr:hypothetical protein B0H17DRAFT_1187077 [Mycena rosella]